MAQVLSRSLLRCLTITDVVNIHGPLAVLYPAPCIMGYGEAACSSGLRSGWHHLLCASVPTCILSLFSGHIPIGQIQLDTTWAATVSFTVPVS